MDVECDSSRQGWLRISQEVVKLPARGAVIWRLACCWRTTSPGLTHTAGRLMPAGRQEASVSHHMELSSRLGSWLTPALLVMTEERRKQKLQCLFMAKLLKSEVMTHTSPNTLLVIQISLFQYKTGSCKNMYTRRWESWGHFGYWLPLRRRV